MAILIGKRKIVLIVEDQPTLLMLAVDLIEEAGFQALEAASAIEAIHILKSRQDVRVVFTDIHLPPGVDGLMLAALIRCQWPLIGLVIVSGFPPPHPEEIPARGIFLAKPYRERELISAVRRVAA